MVVLTRENGAVAREARHLGKCWVSDLLKSFLVQSEVIAIAIPSGFISILWMAKTAQP